MKFPYLLIALAATGRGQTSFTIYNDAKAITRNAGVIRKWVELACNGINGQWTDANQAMADRRTTQAKKKIAEVLVEYNADVLYENTDPRGALIKIVTHDVHGRFYSWSN
jgi:hypothetical protein